MAIENQGKTSQDLDTFSMKLTRVVSTSSITLGVLFVEGSIFYTVERPWLNNKPFVSCIPDGVYPLREHNSPSFGRKLWMVDEVPNRTYILIHVANRPHQLEGCIGIGSNILPELEGVGGSTKALAKLDSLLNGKKAGSITISTQYVK
jgi:hypothetical protein